MFKERTEGGWMMNWKAWVIDLKCVRKEMKWWSDRFNKIEELIEKFDN